MIRGILTTRWLILPIIITACGTAPVTPPAGALEVEEELMLKIINYAEGYRAPKINLDIDLINNPNKLFIYDWVNKKNFDNSFIFKILKSLIPNFIRKKISPNIKYFFQKIIKF